MWSDRLGVLVTSTIVALLVGATIAVYVLDPIPSQVASEAIDGRTVFLTKGCTSCHSIEGVSETGLIGPDLTALVDRAGERVAGLDANGYVRQSILDPQAFIVAGYGLQMPTLPLETDELDALVEFLLG